MRLANVEALKRRLGDGEVIPYADLLRACQDAGAARTRAEAAALAGALDEAGVVLLFRDRVYLQPDKVSSHCRPLLRSPPSFILSRSSRVFSLAVAALVRWARGPPESRPAVPYGLPASRRAARRRCLVC
jgi:hypothetical protein